MRTLRNLVLLPALALLAVGLARAGEWRTDYGKTLAAAKADKKCVLIDFSGSDWCGPCIALKKNVFDQPAFAAYADKNLILLNIDFPKSKALPDTLTRQNDALMHQYGIEDLGLPTVVLLDPDGKVLGQFTGYGGEGPAEIMARLEKYRGR
jgi:protein disulfide-isomerase